jgi:hypothetical protein
MWRAANAGQRTLARFPAQRSGLVLEVRMDLDKKLSPHFMKALLVLTLSVVLTGCMAAPPPVKVASRLLGRTAVQEAAGQITGNNDEETSSTVARD